MTCMDRRKSFAAGMALAVAATVPGCKKSARAIPKVEAIWGRRGIGQGRLQRPRAIVIDEQDRLYLVDITGRIQVFDRNGNLMHYWRTPSIERGRPVGLGLTSAGDVLVADTHYHRLLVYSRQGELLTERTLGGTEGHAPGEFEFVTDAIESPQGFLFVGEYGRNDRIQKFTSDGEFVLEWGGHGGGPGQFRRPQSLKLAPDGFLWIADACNHRIQIYDIRENEPKLVRMWGTPGRSLGQLQFPYDLAFDRQGYVFVCEFGNQRIQKFTLEGEPLVCWGSPGRGPGQLSRPWGVACDSKDRLHVLDTYNHRVQRLHI